MNFLLKHFYENSCPANVLSSLNIQESSPPYVSSTSPSLTKEDTLAPKPTSAISGSTIIMSTEAAPRAPEPSVKIRVQYEENGEIFEQEDTYNNVTGEATISVPAHGDNSGVEVIMQESTVKMALLAVHISTFYH